MTFFPLWVSDILDFTEREPLQVIYMNRLIIFLIPLVILIFAPQSRAATSEIVDPAEILPQGPSIDRFTLDEQSVRNFNERGIFDYMDGAADLFIEYGIERGVAAEYIGEGQKVAVEIFKMKTGDAAFGIYTVSNYTSVKEKKDEEQYKVKEVKEDKPINLKSDNFTVNKDLSIEFFKGQFYGRIAVDKADRLTLLTFANNIMAQIPKALKRPSTLSALPRLDLIPGSERYVCGILGMSQILDVGRGDIWGLKNGAQSVAGEYRLKPGIYYSLAVLIYKQPLVAEDIYNRLKNLFNDLEGFKAISLTPSDATKNLFAVKTPGNDYLGARLISSRIEIYFHVPTPNHFTMILGRNPNVSVKYPSTEEEE